MRRVELASRAHLTEGERRELELLRELIDAYIDYVLAEYGPPEGSREAMLARFGVN